MELPALAIRTPDVGKAMMSAERIRSAGTQNSLLDAKLAREEKLPSMREAVTSASPEDRPAALLNFAKFDPKGAVELEGLIGKLDENQRGKMKAASTFGGKLALFVDQAEDKPAAYQAARKLWVDKGMDASRWPGQYDESFVKSRIVLAGDLDKALAARDKEPKAPRAESFYDKDSGREYKAVWNTATKKWDKVGGSKAMDAKAAKGFTLKPGETHYDAAGKKIAASPAGASSKAPKVESFYDPETGREYKAQWNGKKWVREGGGKAPGGTGKDDTPAAIKTATQLARWVAAAENRDPIPQDFLAAYKRLKESATNPVQKARLLVDVYSAMAKDFTDLRTPAEKKAAAEKFVNDAIGASSPPVAAPAPKPAPSPKAGTSEATPLAKRTTGSREKPFRPATQADFNALPSGAYFINPKDGKTMRKK